MFFYTDAMLLQGHWFDILHVGLVAVLGVYLLCCAVQGWMIRPTAGWLRVVLVAAALCLISGGWLTDAIGLAAWALAWLVRAGASSPRTLQRAARIEGI